MGDKFYTPKLTRTNLFKTPKLDYNQIHNPIERSASDESINSVQSTNTESSDTGELSLVAEYDEIIKLVQIQRQDEVEDAMHDLVVYMKELVNQVQMTQEECRRLHLHLEERTYALSDMEGKLNVARKMVDQEKKHSRQLQHEKLELKSQIRKVKDFLFKDHRGILNQEDNEKLSFLNTDNSCLFDPNMSFGHQLGAIPEVNTTGSLLSEFSYSKSEDDLDTSIQLGKGWKKARVSGGIEPPNKKRRSSTHQRVVEINNTDSVRATTTLTVPKVGPITATSVIESIPLQDDKETQNEPVTPSAPPADIIFDMWQNNQNKGTQINDHKSTLRQHTFLSKIMVIPEICDVCEKKIRFTKAAVKCKDCLATCHPGCKSGIPLPCVPHVNTPVRNLLGLISDFTPTCSPMVPSLIVHCVNEIEARGLKELGVYRIPGSATEVRQLKEKFIRGKGIPNLKDIDIHVICSTVKDFLRCLQEPLITYNLRPQFVICVENDQENLRDGLYRLIEELPQPNRDTLAYMILHLRKVAVAPDCKMPISNLAKLFGPTIVGYSSASPNEQALYTETLQQIKVIEAIMNLDTDYWLQFVNVSQSNPRGRMQQTPSVDSLLRPSVRTPNKRIIKKKIRPFESPQLNYN